MKGLFSGIITLISTILQRLGVTGDRIWRLVIYIAIALPFLAVGYALARASWFAGLVFVVILILWAVTMWMAWFQTYPHPSTTSQIEQRMSEGTRLAEDPNKPHEGGEQRVGDQQPQRA